MRRIAIAAAMLTTLAAADAPPAHLDLEAIDAPAALATVRGWNARTLAALSAKPGFDAYRKRALALLSDPARIAAPDQVIGDRVLNLWQDGVHPRGLWRVSALADFVGGHPRWRTLIDVAALGRAEGKAWTFKGADCLPPAYARCMVALSDGGGDAVVEREFDLGAGRFTDGGFTIPAAKTDTAWIDADTLAVATDSGPGTLTRSGYPASVRLWRRGTPLAAARTIATAAADDVRIAATSFGETRRWPIVQRQIDFYHAEISHLAPDGRLVRSPLPADAQVEDVADGRLLARLSSPFAGAPAGAVVAYSIPDLLAGRTPAIETVFAPNAHQAVEQVGASGSVVWVKYLDDVSGRLAAVTRGGGGRWTGSAAALPDKATVHLNATATDHALAFATVEGVLSPPALFRIEPGRAAVAIQRLPARFDASAMTVEQRFATSKDGTRIPYFLVRKPGAAHGPVPALIHAYGGFEVAQTPSYLVSEPYRSGPAALFWVEAGNAYVLANIRGGNEYGPRWHDAALREKRQNAYDDLYAVSEDLARTGVSAKGRMAVSGRSNGGLMAAVAMTQRPDLWGGAVIGSPLIDMKRYSHLSAGASWIGEYGDPDKPADWAFIRRYSPLQALKPGVAYPTPFIYTSTRDDRVHPGHARRFAARLQDLGRPFYYYEAIEGGHAAGVEPKEDALRAAMVTTYLETVLPR